MSRRGGHRPRGATRGRFCLVTSPISPLCHITRSEGPGERFACDCAYPLANSGAANTGDTGAPEGDLPQREKHPPTTLERIFVWRNDVPPHLREVIRDHRESFQARARRDDGTSECCRRLRRTFGRRHGATRKWRHCLAPSVSAPPGPPRTFF